MAITIVSQNMFHSGLYTPDGDPDPGRWQGQMAALAEHRPDIVLLQEIGKWGEHNHQALFRAERDLGMRMAGCVFTPTGGGVGVMINPDTVTVQQWENRYRDLALHGLGVAVLGVQGLTKPLTVLSSHLNPYSAATAAQEAQPVLARSYRYGGLGLVGGDINHFSDCEKDPVPDPDQIPPYNRSARWKQLSDGTWAPNRIVGETLKAGKMVDVAPLISERSNDPGLLAPTGRGGCRVDQFWVTPPLAPAIVDYERHDHPYSDHSLVVTRLDPAQVNEEAALREFV